MVPSGGPSAIFVFWDTTPDILTPCEPDTGPSAGRYSSCEQHIRYERRRADMQDEPDSDLTRARASYTDYWASETDPAGSTIDTTVAVYAVMVNNYKQILL